LQSVDDKYDSVDTPVHLAAIAAPGLTTNAAAFDNNITWAGPAVSAGPAATVRP
jgi:hypothetical protein